MGFKYEDALDWGVLGSKWGAGLFGGGDDKGKAMKMLLEQMQRAQNLGAVKAEGYGAQGLRSLNQNFDSAIGNIARTGAASRSAAIGAGQRAGAASQQSLAGRGLYNTSALDASKAMNAGATSQALAGIDQAVAQAKGGLQAQKGQAVNAANFGLAQMAQQHAQNQMMPLQMAYQSAASAPTDWDKLMQLFQAGGQIAGMGMGGGFG
jgi:hypothetical protein